MKFSQELTYDAAPQEVLAMLADPAFREKVCDAMKVERREVGIDGAAGEGMQVVVDQTQPAQGLPSFAKKIVGEELRIVQRETWSDDAHASLDVEIPGKPGTFAGAIALAADGSGTVESVTGEVRVKVPLVGGKLEGLVADMLGRALKTENRVGRAWLAGDR